MSDTTNIEWADSTFNPWEGCTKVGPGCDHCYAENRNARFAGGQAINWGPGAPRRRTTPANWRKPLQWEREAAAFQAEHGRCRRVFCASLADVFDNEVDPAWRDDLWQLIQDTPSLDWLLLTKRIGNVFRFLPDGWALGHGAWPNVWLGATIVNQAEAERDIPKLLALPARIRFLSMEPLLGPVDLTIYHDWLGRSEGGMWCPDCPEDGVGIDPDEHHGCQGEVVDAAPYDGIDWVIVGGESGPGARPMHRDWARSLRDQCAAAGVPFLFKQWGEWAPNWLIDDEDGSETPDSIWMDHMGKKTAGRLLDGAEHNGFPRSSP
jgi:protein gp37